LERDVLVIAGSARRDGNTGRVVARLSSAIGARMTLIDLNDLDIAPFRYGGTPDCDDFASVASAMRTHRHILFATPVYWYAMSGRMKILFDRFTDLLGNPDGRALAGRHMWLVATGTDADLPDGFDVPFARTADWCAMDWRGATYILAESEAPLSETALARLDELASTVGG
jgi:multimeric flavodoxin WrbA